MESDKISVCIASFQGERYIEEQLRSILEQLSADDEVIVVDDHSSDRTCDLVRGLGDERIRLITHEENRGAPASFEEALSKATGNIVFLSDQDDLWAPGKVQKVLRVFKSDPVTTLVVTDATLIDESASHSGASYYAHRGKFRPGFVANVIRSKYLGCTMAFRSELIAKVIPFPLGYDVLHDIWIGVVNSVSRGKTRYLDEPLVWYRRHSGALTGGHLSLKRKVRTRVDLFRAVMGYWARNITGRRVGS